AILQQNRLSIASLGLDRVRRFLLTMEMESAASAERRAELAAALDAAARRLGLRILLGEPVSAGDRRPVLPPPELRNAPEPLPGEETASAAHDPSALKDHSFAPVVAPKRAKDEELDDEGRVRLNPLWMELKDITPSLLTRDPGAVWLFTVTEDLRVLVGSEQASAILGKEQLGDLVAGMRAKDPTLAEMEWDRAVQTVVDRLDGLGHVGIAAGFVKTVPEDPDQGKTTLGMSRVSGEFRWSENLRCWTVNDKSGRYMSEKVRGKVDPQVGARWLTNVAKLFSARLGVEVRIEQFKTAPPAAAAPAVPTHVPLRPGRPEWHAEIVLNEVKDESGQVRGLASYGSKDMATRAPALAHVSSLTTYTAWHTDAEGNVVPVTRRLPGGEKAFHWLSHGTAGRPAAATRDGRDRPMDGDELVDVIESRLGDATDIVVWSCQTGPGVDRRATLGAATRVAERTGRRVHVPEWETAVDFDSATNTASAHTYADPQGRETGWTSVSPRPAASADPGGVLIEPAVGPQEGETFGHAPERALDRSGPPLPELRNASAVKDVKRVRWADEEGAGLGTASGSTSAPSPEPSPSQGEEPERTERRSPWYLDVGALGEATVLGADSWTEEEVRLWAHHVASGSHRTDDSPNLSGGIQNTLREILRTEDPGEWDTLLQRGHLFLADGHLVWLRPVLRDARLGTQPSGTVREYSVSFASLAAGGKRTNEVAAGLDGMLLTFFSLGLRTASALIPGVPALGMSSADRRGEEWEVQLIAGRKLFVGGYTRFRAGLAVRVFVDGRERPNDAVLPARLDVDLPNELTTPDAPRPRTNVRTGPGRRSGRRPSQSAESLNAVDLIPVMADLQRRLLDAGLPAGSVLTAIHEVGEHLTEKSARNRSRLLLTSGVPTKRVRVPASRTSSFEGHFLISADIETLQYFGHSEVTVREDTGSGLTDKPGRGKDSGVALGLAFNVAGLTDPAHHDDAGKGFVRGPGLTLGFSRAAGNGMAEQALGHTVLTRDSTQARYRSGLRVNVDIRSTTHDIPKVSTVVESEVGVAEPEAADFERRLTGSALPKGAFAQTRVWTLFRTPHGAVPKEAYRRPSRLDRVMPVDPRHHEPLPLATRRGLGFGTAATLPGAELVLEQLRTVMERRHDTLAKGAKADWSEADLHLAAWYSRPALEADLPTTMSGIERTVRVGGRDYRLSARAYLMERLKRDQTTYPMTVNLRALAAASSNGHRATELGVRLAAGIGARVTAFTWLRFALGAAGAQGGYSYSPKRQLTGGVKSYRRTETTGQVDEHPYNVIYALSVRSPGGQTDIWWIDQRGDVTGRVALPREHRPAIPPTPEQITAARQVSELLLWPQDSHAALTRGVSGLFPAFFVLPELWRMAARMYAGANDLPDSWLEDSGAWPEAIKDATRPGRLAAHFASLTSRTGRYVALPRGKDGRKQALRFRLRGYRPRHLYAGDDTEIEQYAQSNTAYKDETKHTWEGGPAFSAGPQFRLGGEAEAPHSLSPEDGDWGGHSPETDKNTGPGGRIQLTANADARWERKSEHAEEQGPVDITRATYGGRTHTYRMDPVFEVTLIRWKGDSVTWRSRLLRATDALDVVVPERRIFDLGLTAPGVTPPSPSAPTRHVPPGLLPGMAYPETMDAEDVLPRIESWLRAENVLRPLPGHGDRPNLLTRELEAAYSSDALRNQFAALIGSGVVRWIPLPRAFGAMRYLYVRVTARIAAADRQLPRPDVRLTLRDEGQRKSTVTKSSGFGYGGGFTLRTRAGKEGHEGGHGGIEGGGGYHRSSARGVEKSEKALEIYRAGTREGSQEYGHPLAFRIEIGLSGELPEIVNVPARGIRLTTVGLGRLFHARSLGELWHAHGIFLRHHVIEPGPHGVTGRVRLLVPDHIALLDAPPDGLRPVLGRDPAWDARPLWAGRDPEAVEALIVNLHPWGVPFADAVERWAGLPSSPFGRPKSLNAPGAWRVPGLDFTTWAGLRYLHFTAQNTMRPNIKDVLRNVYEVPVGDRKTIVGAEIVAAEVIGPLDGTNLKGRNYTQDSEADKDTSEDARGRHLSFGPEAGGEMGQARSLGIGGFAYAREQAEELSGELGGTEEKNKEATRRYRHYRFSLVLVMRGHHGTLRVRAPRGLYGMIPLEERPEGGYRLVGGLEESLPDLFGRPRRHDAENPGWHDDVVLHQVRDDSGRFHGLASYSAPDLAARRRALSGASALTSYTAWHTGAEGAPVPVARPLPVGPGRTAFHWFSDGRAGRATAARHGSGTRPMDSEEFAGLIGGWLDGFSDIVMWPRQSGPAVNRRAALAFASRVGELTGRRVHLPEWETALDRDETSGDMSTHTYPDPDGGETGWISVSPRTVPPGEAGGVLVELPVPPAEGEPFGRVLARVLDRAAPLLADRDGLTAGGVTPYEWFVAALTEEDLPVSVPLAGDPAGGPDRVRRFLRALETTPATPETVTEMTAALETVARRLGVRLVAAPVVDAGTVRPVRTGPDRGTPPVHA
ncbi:MAG: hypothetical protein JWR24_4504, partial [Actinoallomurus sp.]|nr:hypothetical protein [Actinoallomurus sp.]